MPTNSSTSCRLTPWARSHARATTIMGMGAQLAAMLLFAPLSAVAASCADLGVWPLPMTCEASGARVPIAPSGLEIAYSIDGGATSPRLDRAIARYAPLINGGATQAGRGGAAPLGEAATLSAVSLVISSPDETLSYAAAGAPTYDLSIGSGRATVQVAASSIYGAMHALETLAQLVFGDSNDGDDGGGASLPVLELGDTPTYGHRGLMVDAGRRFTPLPLLERTIDAMAMYKLNVLHLHAADFCRMAVASKAFPELTAGLVGDQAGFLSQVVVVVADHPVSSVSSLNLERASRDAYKVNSVDRSRCVERPSPPQLSPPRPQRSFSHSTCASSRRPT